MRTRGRQEPYTYEHRDSLTRKARPPKDLLGWFVTGYRAEMPEQLHSAGLWRDQVSAGERDRGIAAVGGSVLGSPRTSEAVRRLTEESPFITQVAEFEGHKDRANHYTFPMRAAIARLAGRGKVSDPFPFMAYALTVTARLDGDWEQALTSLGVNPPAVRSVYIEHALRTLYARYEDEPRQAA